MVVDAGLRAGRDPAAPIGRASRGGAIALSFAQERLWFLDQLSPGDASYIVPTALRLEGPLDAAALARAIAEIVARHEVLRTTFAISEGRPVAVIHLPSEVPLPVTRWPSLPTADREGRAPARSRPKRGSLSTSPAARSSARACSRSATTPTSSS